MAISPCHNCGRSVSWEDMVCPHCGVQDPASLGSSGNRDALAEESSGTAALRRGVTAVILVVVVLSLLALLGTDERMVQT